MIDLNVQCYFIELYAFKEWRKTDRIKAIPFGKPPIYKPQLSTRVPRRDVIRNIRTVQYGDRHILSGIKIPSRATRVHTLPDLSYGYKLESVFIT